jgi:hypothetical protein
MNPLGSKRSVFALAIFSAVFLALTVTSFVRTSATFDEPLHLTTGYMQWRDGDFRFDIEHPPFQRMWDALPLLMMGGVQPAERTTDQTDPIRWVQASQFLYAHDFLYKMNDADRLLYRARFMTALLGIALGILIFCWVHEWLGFWPAVAALGFCAFEPNLLAHSSLVTTDFGVTCFIFGAAYFLWRLSRRISVANVAGLTTFSALALISKFSGVVLGPILIALIAVRVFRSAPWPCSVGKPREIASPQGKVAAGAAIVLIVGLFCWGAIWAAYSFRYMPSSTPGWQFQFQKNSDFRAGVPSLTAAAAWIDSRKLLPNAYTEGFLLGQDNALSRSNYLDGRYSLHGWWYFFPVAFLIKTPVSLIALFLAGLVVLAARWREFLQNGIYIAVPPAVFLIAAMNSNLNIGLRHILPVYPFVVLLATLCVSYVLQARSKIPVTLLAVLCVFWLFEFARVYPHNLAFFNSFVGGPANGYKYLADSNLDWGQDLKPLKQWMDSKKVDSINLAYFGTADPQYYKISCTYLPGGPFYITRMGLKLPGYIAVSDTILDGVYLNPAGRAYYAQLRALKPVADIGYSIRVYWIDGSQ